MKQLAALLLLACAVALPAGAQQIPVCPTAVPGTVWATTPPAAKAWLPCSQGRITVTPPIPATAIVSDMRCTAAGACTFTWMLATQVLPTDSVFVSAPAASWVKASTLAFASSGPAVPTYTAPAVLSWTAPTANVDGTPLTNLGGFNVYSGPSATALTKLATVPAASLAYATQVSVGTTYFAVTAINSAAPPGESVQSAVVSRTLAAPTAAVPNPPVMTP